MEIWRRVMPAGSSAGQRARRRRRRHDNSNLLPADARQYGTSGPRRATGLHRPHASVTSGNGATHFVARPARTAGANLRAAPTLLGERRTRSQAGNLVPVLEKFRQKFQTSTSQRCPTGGWRKPSRFILIITRFQHRASRPNKQGGNSRFNQIIDLYFSVFFKGGIIV